MQSARGPVRSVRLAQFVSPFSFRAFPLDSGEFALAFAVWL